MTIAEAAKAVQSRKPDEKEYRQMLDAIIHSESCLSLLKIAMRDPDKTVPFMARECMCLIAGIKIGQEMAKP